MQRQERFVTHPDVDTEEVIDRARASDRSHDSGCGSNRIRKPDVQAPFLVEALDGMRLARLVP